MLSLAGVVCAALALVLARGISPTSSSAGCWRPTASPCSSICCSCCVAGLDAADLDRLHPAHRLGARRVLRAAPASAPWGMMIMASSLRPDRPSSWGWRRSRSRSTSWRGSSRDQIRSNEAALKYFCSWAPSPSGFVLYGIALVYGATGSIEPDARGPGAGAGAGARPDPAHRSAWAS
ncbi:MAG: hypothetical protein MZV64_27920 [Ignavibacteriales bacterium]|nr:hypothetical protein [Ignavibacteriales bacterium]